MVKTFQDILPHNFGSVQGKQVEKCKQQPKVE